ncbi:S-layer homology domain-containing protein [Bacillus sp. FJAT-52991]|uniref:S-layer homology domain-containing protein n=1 Tax=Bacillus kandeliae TaxID=3129297 RepID=A0ABZ2N6I3_9BACI
MGFQAKSYRKFIAASATATLVATAVTPAFAAGFTDVNDRVKDAVNYLVDNEIAKGTSDTTFGTYNEIIRADAAVMIANALKLDTTNAPDAGFTDVPARAKGAVNALKAAGILNGKTETKFGANDNLTRGEMAIIITRAYKLDGEGTNHSFSDVGKNYTAAVNALLKNKITSGKTDTTFGTADNINRGDFAVFLYRAETLEVADVAIESVAAMNPTSAKVTFSKPVDKLDKANVAVANKATGQKQLIKSITLSEDKKSATVEFYESVKANQTYTFDVTMGTDKLASELVVGSLKPAEILVEDQTVVAGQATPIKYVIKDENGVDVTANYPANAQGLSFESPAQSAISNGVITLQEGLTTTVKVVYKENDKVVAESKTATISANKEVPTTLSNWTVAAAKPNFADANYKQNTVVHAGDSMKIFTQVKDQFGLEITNPTVEFESLNTGVAVVDKSTGQITVMGTGKAPIKVTVKNGDKVAFTQTIELDVREAVAIKEVKLDQSALTLSTNDQTGLNVKATVLDQFGNPMVNQEVKTTVKDSKTDVVADASVTTDDKGVATINVKAKDAAAAGKYVVEIKAGEVKTELAVELKAPGAFAHYDVRGLANELDINTKDAKNKMTVSTLSVDNSGLAIQEETGATVVVKDKDGKALAADSTKVGVAGNVITLGKDAKAGEEYTVEVTLDKKVIKTHTFKVVDTTEQAKIEFTSTTVNLKSTDSFNNAIANIIKLDGATVAAGEVTGVTVVSSDSGVVETDANGTPTKLTKGSTTVFVKEIEVTKMVNGNPVKSTVKIDPVFKLTVNVTE